MRCRNCGADNDDKRYICEVCGSPLYEEGELPVNNRKQPIDQADEQRTQTFTAVNTPNDNGTRQRAQEPSINAQRPQSRPNQSPQPQDDGKKSIIVIAILAVILVAIVASIFAVAHNKKAENGQTTSELTRISTTVEETTKKETTTQTTTESTTKQTTTEVKWIINTGSSGGGEAEGDGEYKNGEKVTLIARADDGYVFDGWYSNGIKVSSDTQYTFKANENASFSAVFNPVETQSQPMEIPDQTGAEVVFGE